MKIKVEFTHKLKGYASFNETFLGFPVSKLIRGPQMPQIEDDVLAIVEDEVYKNSVAVDPFYSFFTVEEKKLWKADNENFISIDFSFIAKSIVVIDVMDLNFTRSDILDSSLIIERIWDLLSEDYDDVGCFFGLAKAGGSKFYYNENNEKLKNIFTLIARSIKFARLKEHMQENEMK